MLKRLRHWAIVRGLISSRGDVAAEFERAARQSEKQMRYLLGRGNPFQQAARRELRGAILIRMAATTVVIVVGWLIFKTMADDMTALILGISVAAALTGVLFVVNAIGSGGFDRPLLMAARSAGVFVLGALAALVIVAYLLIKA